MSTELEKWYVYRHSLPFPSPVLKLAETTLEITREDGVCSADFEIEGRTEKVTVEGTEVVAGVWHGTTARFDFRWAHAPCGTGSILAGEVSREGMAHERRDFFVAVRTKRTSPLPRQDVYHFAEARLAPSESGAPERTFQDLYVHWGEEQSRITFLNAHDNQMVTLTDVEIRSDAGGFRVRGRFVEGATLRRELGLWILPGDGTGGLLATGYYFDSMHTDAKFSRPFDVGCTGRLHAC